jgi:hypothetical protein
MDNGGVIRRLISLGLALAVPAGAMCAPFLHAHIAEDHDGHHATEVHSHFSSHAPLPRMHDGIAVEDADHDAALYLQIFVAVEATPFAIPDIAVATFTLTLPAERAPRTSVLVAHGHDPPLVQALNSRPPPLAFLS